MPFLHIRLAKRQGVDQPLLLLQNRVLPLSGEAGFFCHFQTLSDNGLLLSLFLSLSGCDMGGIPSCLSMSGGCAWDARGRLMSGSLR